MKNILGKLTGIIASASEASRNGRRYTQNFWDQIFDSDLFKEGLKNKMILGELYHPDYNEEYGQIHVDPNKTAVVLTEVNKKGLDYYGTFEILPTLAGETLKNLYDIGCVFGVSSRGYNDYDTDVFNDPSTFELITFDIVAFPGIKSARLHPVAAVAEGLNTRRVNKTKIMENLQRIAGENEQMKEYIDTTLDKAHDVIGKDIEKYQKWVDYDMKHYGKISDNTQKYLKDAGLQVVTDQYGDYEVTAGKYKEDLDVDVQSDELADINLIPDELKDYAIIVKTNSMGAPYYDDGVHGRRYVSYNGLEFNPDEEFLVDDIYYDEDAGVYRTVGEWLQIK